MSIVIISGYFDPIHVGHIELIERAKKLGMVLVIVNNDYQCKLKKGKSFMSEQERLKIVYSTKGVDYAVLSIDKDRTVRKTLTTLGDLREWNPFVKLIFANGGDVTKKNCREEVTCKKLGIKTIYGLGKKIQSSSKLTGLKEK